MMTINLVELSQLCFTRFDPATGLIEDNPVIERRLSDLAEIFIDRRAYESALKRGNPVVYTTSSVEPAQGEGALHYGLCKILPGRVGQEFYMTKGHYHTWRQAGEYYIGLSGEGLMLLENETTGQSQVAPLLPHSAVYVPGFTAHRTINVGTSTLTYLGIYPALAGHDYKTLARHNFRQVAIDVAGKPTLVDRETLITSVQAN